MFALVIEVFADVSGKRKRKAEEGKRKDIIYVECRKGDPVGKGVEPTSMARLGRPRRG